ncbi:hypothetical protein SUGI_1008880 [Cryptomeria japonica]|nr:hypothetical protein SUGI_1008880 [Cryptomeria japonica]
MQRRFQGFQQYGYGGRFRKSGYRHDFNHSRPRGVRGGGLGENSNNPSWAESSEPEMDIVLPEEIEDDIALWSEMVVIGRFIGARISRLQTRAKVKENWSQDVVLKFIPKGFFIVVFREETVRNRILNQQNWFFGSAHLYLQPWQSNFDLVPLAMYKEPIWIRLYNLPMEYWGESSLECIGRSLGTLLEVDEDIIENGSYLYARIKIAVIKKVPSAIYLKASERRWKQQVEVELRSSCREKGESKDHSAGFCPGISKPAKKWVQIVGECKVVTATVSPEKEILQKSDAPRASKSDGNSGECPGTSRNAEKEGDYNPLMTESLLQKKGFSNTKIEYDRVSDDDSFQEDVLDNLDQRCISQSANILLGKAKGSRGRRSNKQRREDRAKEKGIINVFEFMKKAKGVGASLGER